MRNIFPLESEANNKKHQWFRVYRFMYGLEWFTRHISNDPQPPQWNGAILRRFWSKHQERKSISPSNASESEISGWVDRITQVSLQFGKWGHFWKYFDHSSLWAMDHSSLPGDLYVFGESSVRSLIMHRSPNLFIGQSFSYAHISSALFLLSRPLCSPKLSPLIRCTASLH
jgi:hypothetical protein